MSATTERSPWLDSGRPLDERVDVLLGEMTLDEKVGQTNMVANVDPAADGELIRAGAVGASLYASGAEAGNERDDGVLAANIDASQRHAVEGSRLGIPLLFGRDVIHGHRTVFPIPLGLASSFDERLVEEAARIAAAEASRNGIAWTFAPMVDLSEDPRWGRVAESFGEAPVLSGRLGAAAVRGFEGADVGAPGCLAGCAKHFAGYGLAAGGRDYNTVTVGENTLRNLHLRPFRAAVEAGVSTVMAAFNDIDGIPMHAHRHLLRDVLKDEWGFTGVVVADWNGIGQLVDQGVAADLRSCALQAIDAGVDLDMVSGAYAAHLAELVRCGAVPVELLDDAVARILRLKLRLGLFERPYAGDRAASPEPTSARAVARRAAHAAHVLVANDGTLPLDGAIGTVLLTGPFADDGAALLGTWTLDGRAEDVVVPATALRQRLGDGVVVDGGRFGDETVRLAKHAGVTIALVGEHPGRSGEANCVSDIGLPAGQLDVLRQLAGTGTPLVVVVYTGRPLALGPVFDVANAVLVVWHPGVEAGAALDAVLFGDAEPVGHLPMTFPRSSGHIPTSTHQRHAGRLAVDADHAAYLDAPTTPLLPFGHGLGYTDFSYDPPRLRGDRLAIGGGTVGVDVDVSNTGARRGVALVQLYFRDPVAEVTRPLRELLDWTTIELGPGEAATASFAVRAEQFAYTGRDLRPRADAGEIVLMTGPDAGHLSPVTLTITAPLP